MWHDVLFLRAEGLAVLREWESTTPFLAVYGTSGIGKSTLLQLAALRALVLGDPVLLHVRGGNNWCRWSTTRCCGWSA
jgi:predicted ABC-type transport system involved in lysophospholipase L1 biosynthesis ATPase subunit